jgi:hypothetical protein
MYEGITHRRRVLLEGKRLFVLDELTGGPDEHALHQHWHIGDAARPSVGSSAKLIHETAPYSPVYGTLRNGTRITASVQAPFPQRIATAFGIGTAKTTVEELALRFEGVPQKS